MFAQQFVEQEKKLKLIVDKQNHIETRVDVVKENVDSQLRIVNKRISNLDKINPEGTDRDLLARMVRKYAQDIGANYGYAWVELKRAYNTAYRTNIGKRLTHYKELHGLKKVTLPEYLEVNGLLPDAIRVMDKLLNPTPILRVEVRSNGYNNSRI